LFRLFAAATLALAVFSSSGTAQTQQQQPGKTQFGPRANKQQPGMKGPGAEVVATHGAWKIQCEVPAQGAATEGQAAGQKQCGMVQVTRSEKNEKIGLSLVIVKAKQGEKQVTMMRVMAPIGVFLPTGIALEIDGAAVGRVPFTRCLPQICIAFAEASKETLEKMRKGNAANFIISEAPGINVSMKISLEGFSKAIEALDQL
jgi:invasion protein IalB